MEFIIETSARHVHVKQETLEILFGKGAELEIKKMLSQPGQYVSNQKVKVVGPKGELACSILGPCRNVDQVELSLTDARTIGVSVPVRESGDIVNSTAVTLVGPCGKVELTQGAIAAKRHIHMTEDDATKLNVKNGDIVNVKVNSDAGRGLIFLDTVVRVSNSYSLAMHIDTDESNAGCLTGNVTGTIVR